MNDIQITIWEALKNLTGEDVLQLFTNWYGMSLLDEDFAEFIEDEGYSV